MIRFLSWKRCFVQTVAIGATVILAACATPSEKNTLDRNALWPLSQNKPSFEASGRLAVKYEGKGSYANFNWLNTKQVQIIEINTPIGSTVGTLCQDQQGVIAQNSQGEVFEDADAESLSKRLVGFQIPLQYLPIWAQGQRVDAPYQISPDGVLQQFSWNIRRTLKNDGSIKTLQLHNPNLNIRLIFDRFEYNEVLNNQKICEVHHS